MRNNLPPVLIAVSLSLLLLGVAAWIAPHSPTTNPVIVSCPALDSDPQFYSGATVQISTAGMQATDNSRELIYRKHTDKPPIVVCRFAKPVPDPLPKYIVGICQGRHGDAVLVVECR